MKVYMATQIDIVVFECRKISPTWNRWNCVIYRTKNISPTTQTVATERIAPKICQGQPLTFGSQCSSFIQIGLLSAEL